MTDEEIENAYQEMVTMFGENLPDPEHYPKIFSNYVKLWKFYKYQQVKEPENGI